MRALALVLWGLIAACLPTLAHAQKTPADIVRLQGCMAKERAAARVSPMSGIVQIGYPTCGNTLLDGCSSARDPFVCLIDAATILHRVAMDVVETSDVQAAMLFASRLTDQRRTAAQIAFLNIEPMGYRCSFSTGMKIGTVELSIADSCVGLDALSGYGDAQIAKVWADELRTSN